MRITEVIPFEGDSDPGPLPLAVDAETPVDFAGWGMGAWGRAGKVVRARRRGTGSCQETALPDAKKGRVPEGALPV